MRNVVLFSISLLLLLAAGCKDKNEPEKECRNPYSEDIIGRWKLVEVSVNINYGSQRDTIDYSESNIIFNFQENNKLVVSGQIPDIPAILINVDFQEGEYFYGYGKHWVSCVGGDPAPNLTIADQGCRIWEEYYFCTVPLDKETMWIGGYKKAEKNVIGENEPEIKQGYQLWWSKKLIRIKE